MLCTENMRCTSKTYIKKHVRRTNIPSSPNYLWQFHAAYEHSSRCLWSSDRAARSQVTRLPPRKRLRLLLMDQVQNLRNQVSRPHHHLKKLHHVMDCNRQLFIHSSNKRIILYINSFLQSHFCMHFTTCVTSSAENGGRATNLYRSCSTAKNIAVQWDCSI